MEIEIDIRSHLSNELSNSTMLKTSLEDEIIKNFINKNTLIKLWDHSEENLKAYMRVI